MGECYSSPFKFSIMSINLLETVQKNLGYPPLHKIDPNTQDSSWDKTPLDMRFGQAAIPAVLTALYLCVQSDDCAKFFLENRSSSGWVDRIFVDNTKPAVQIIADYSATSSEETVQRLNTIAEETVKAVKTQLTPNADIKEVKAFFNNQRKTLLLYLPTQLHMGELLHDNVLDDNVNKMEGPVSGFMNKLGSVFSQPVTEKEIKHVEERYEDWDKK
jgi:hypothetical protein